VSAIDATLWNCAAAAVLTPLGLKVIVVICVPHVLLQDDYRQWELPEYQHHGAHDNTGPRKTLPFTGASTYADVYKIHPMEPYCRVGPATGYKGDQTQSLCISSLTSWKFSDAFN